MERIFADGDRFAGGEPVGAGDVAGFDVAAEFAFETFELTESGGGGLARVVAGWSAMTMAKVVAIASW